MLNSDTELGLRLSQRTLVGPWQKLSEGDISIRFLSSLLVTQPDLSQAQQNLHPLFFFWVMLPPYPLAGAGNTACKDMGYPFVTVVGLKNNPPEKPLGRGRLMEDLTLRTVVINQFLITLGSWRVLPGLFLEKIKNLFLHFLLPPSIWIWSAHKR